MSVEEASAYLKMPMATLYMKLGNGSIPATKPASVTAFIKMNLTSGWRLTARILYLSQQRRRMQPILAGNKRKPKPLNW